MDVGVLEAKNRLSELLDRAERGEEITITRHGKPVATLSKVVSRTTADDRESIFQRVRLMRETLPKTTWSEIKKDIESDRRE